jgi:hypothetical protein
MAILVLTFLALLAFSAAAYVVGYLNGREDCREAASPSPRAKGGTGNDHTPGPWRITDLQSHDDWFVQGGDHGHEFIGAIVKREADARLIAAAPDLLAALEFIATLADLGDLQNSHDVILLKARAAIAGALGSPDPASLPVTEKG